MSLLETEMIKEQKKGHSECLPTQEKSVRGALIHGIRDES